MKYFSTLLLAFILLPNLLLAQNLVPNFSFEDTVACPSGDGDMNAVDFWFSARSTPDYFHTCANITSPIVGVPQNIVGYQCPFNGVAYSGFYSYSTVTFYREILGISLQQPLQSSTEYFVSAYVSRANANFAGGNFDCATNKLGFRFSTVKYEAFTSHEAPIDNFAHISSNAIIYDTTNWVLISGSFIADSAYTYLNIGNFFDDMNTSVSPCIGSSYYYLDAICVSSNPLICDIAVGTNPMHQKEIIKIFPNPANNTLNIKNIVGDHEYAIINNTNSAVRSGVINESNNTIDVSNLPNGLYFFQLLNNQTYKFIISH